MRNHKRNLIVLFFALFLGAWFYPQPISMDNKPQLQNRAYSHWKERVQMTFGGLSDNSCEAIWIEATKYHLNPTLVTCWVEVESGFDSLAVGSNGDLGLLQVKLATAQMYDSSVSEHDLFLTDTNVRIALTHLNHLMQVYKSEALAFSAYNLGQGRLNSMLECGQYPHLRYYSRIIKLYKKINNV